MFWRWCIWKLFESEGAPGRGVVCLITNRTFLAGHPYAGLRQLLRSRFETIDIIDLRGDSRGARPAGINVDENMFEVQVGVAIVIASSSGTRPIAGTAATVRYADIWKHNAFSEGEKLAVLEQATIEHSSLNFVSIDASGLQDFIPPPFAGLDWPSICEVFLFRSSGVETKRDDFVYGLSPAILALRLQELAGLDEDDARKLFHETPMRTVAAALARPLSDTDIKLSCYRPLDRRFLLADSRFLDRRRRHLQHAWGDSNVCLFSLPFGTGEAQRHGLIAAFLTATH